MSEQPRIAGERVLITGGAGFIGATLAGRLIAENQVVVFDNFHRDALTRSGLMGHSNLTVIRGDVLDADAVDQAMQDATMVVHLAAIAGVDTVLKRPTQTMRVNIIGTYHVLEAAVHHGRLSRFIDFSTSEVFGTHAYNASEGEATVLGAVGEARWTYAVSKLATEHMALTYHKEYRLPALSIRPFNIYGPGQVGEGAIHHFIVRALKGEDLVVHNDGAQIRAWCYVDDIVDGICLALTSPSAPGHAFNIGNPRSTLTIYNLARDIIKLVGSSSSIQFVKWDFPDVELRIPNIDKARRLLGFSPKVNLEEGLERTIAWYRDQMQRGTQP
jgi:nucleoside-diphosphate-sugar epimerase